MCQGKGNRCQLAFQCIVCGKRYSCNPAVNNNFFKHLVYDHEIDVEVANSLIAGHRARIEASKQEEEMKRRLTYVPDIAPDPREDGNLNNLYLCSLYVLSNLARCKANILN